MKVGPAVAVIDFLPIIHIYMLKGLATMSGTIRRDLSWLTLSILSGLALGWAGLVAAPIAAQESAATDTTTQPSQESTEAKDQETTSESAPAAEPTGQELLDQAFQMKLNAQKLNDLDKVVETVEKAIATGLDEGTKKFANELISSTLLEKAMQVVGPVLEGQLDLTWNQRRRMGLADLERAIKANPQDGESQLVIAQLQLLPEGDLERGKGAADEAVKLLANESERHSIALVIRASFCEDPKERLPFYDRAIASNERNAKAWRDRGKTRFEMGQTEEALQDFQHLLELDADDVETLQVVAAVFASQEKFDEALKHANHMIEVAQDQVGGYLVRSRIYMAQGDMQKAEADLDQVLDISPRDLGTLLTRARLRQARDANEEALADVQRVLQLRPGLPQAVLLRSVLYVATKRFSKAIEDIQSLLQSNPDSVELKLQLAGIYLANERPTLAVKTYDEILASVTEGAWIARRGRADAYLSLGKHADAVRDYEEVIKEQPEDSGVLNNFAWVLATSPLDEVRDGKRAIELAKKACEVTEYKEAHIISTLAAGYAETGNFDEAKQWATKAIELADESIKTQLQGELDQYNQGKPFREMQVVKEPADGDELIPGEVPTEEAPADNSADSPDSADK